MSRLQLGLQLFDSLLDSLFSSGQQRNRDAGSLQRRNVFEIIGALSEWMAQADANNPSPVRAGPGFTTAGQPSRVAAARPRGVF